MPVKPVPDGYHTLTPYLIVKDAARAIAYYQKVFGARERMRFPGTGGRISHAELEIGDSVLMLADEHPGMGAVSPETVGGTPAFLMVYVPNVDQVFERAIAAGATSVQPLKDQFYGDRSGTLKDPFGHQWTIATHIEEVTIEEAQHRMEALMKQKGGA